MRPHDDTTEAGLLDAARAGDEDAFRRLVEPLRSQLLTHCYRMLGSMHDAEDALQDALLRAWRGLAGFEGRASARAWLYRIATNACLDMAGRRSRRLLPASHGPPAGPDDDAGERLAESVWIEPFPDDRLGLDEGAWPQARYEQREGVELAFIVALQHLPGRQRAVLILRDVLGFSAAEVGQVLDTTTASVNSALQRARAAVEERLPERSQQATLRSLGDEGVRDLVERFVTAFEGGDVEAIVGLLTDDVVFAMPPYAAWYRGRDAVADSWLLPERTPTGLRYAVTRANGQIALGTYAWDADRGSHLPIALDVLTLRDGLIAEVVAFRSPDVFPAFGLAEELGPPGVSEGRAGAVRLRPHAPDRPEDTR